MQATTLGNSISAAVEAISSTFISFRSTRGGLQAAAGFLASSSHVTACLRACDSVRCIIKTERGDSPPCRHGARGQGVAVGLRI